MRPNGLVGESAGTAHAGVRGVASEDVDAHGDDGGSELDRWRRLGPRRGVCVAGLSSVRLRGIAGWMSWTAREFIVDTVTRLSRDR